MKCPCCNGSGCNICDGHDVDERGKETPPSPKKDVGGRCRCCNGGGCNVCDGFPVEDRGTTRRGFVGAFMAAVAALFVGRTAKASGPTVNLDGGLPMSLGVAKHEWKASVDGGWGPAYTYLRCTHKGCHAFKTTACSFGADDPCPVGPEVKSFRTRCPRHEDKHASLTTWADGSYYCYACGASFSVLTCMSEPYGYHVTSEGKRVALYPWLVRVV